MIRVCVAAIVAVLLVQTAEAQQTPNKPWPAKVEGFEPVKPGEHPRLLFRESDLPALRARARTPEGQALIKRLKQQLGGDGLLEPASYYSEAGEAYSKEGPLPEGAYTMSHAAGYGMLYQLTGEAIYAELGKACFQKAFEGVRDRDDRYSWINPGGALRAGPTLGWYALGYDLCYDGWDEDFRKKVAQAIQNHPELPGLVVGERHMPASNHWGMQVGGGAMAVLAINQDPGVDQKQVDQWLVASRKAMVRNATEGWSDYGWFAEGDGTGVMSSHIIYLPAIQAWRNAGGLDFASPRPNIPWMVLKFVMGTIPVDGKPVTPMRGGYPHNVWSPTGVSGPGTFVSGFGIVDEKHKPALLWLYNRIGKHVNPSGETPFETRCEYPHRTVLAFVNWPFEMREKNPAEVLPNNLYDPEPGYFVFRNRWQDADDILVHFSTKSTHGWMGTSPSRGIAVWGLGRRFGNAPPPSDEALAHLKGGWSGPTRGTCVYYQPYVDGSGVLSLANGTSIAVDFSKASGADLMLVRTGPGLPAQGVVTMDGREYAFFFLGEPTAQPRVVDGRIVVGEQTVSFIDRHLVLGKHAEPRELSHYEAAGIAPDAVEAWNPKQSEADAKPQAEDESEGDDKPAMTVVESKAEAEQNKPDPNEQIAAQRLASAKTWIEKDKARVAKQILEEVLIMFPDTQAAQEAATLIKTLD